MADNLFRPPKPWSLTETETITSFVKWQSNLLYHLSLNNEFSVFLESEWQKKSVQNHGFVADEAPVAENQRKTAAQKSIILDRMLGLISQFAPSLLTNDVLKKSTSLSWIWKRIRKYYSFSPSEANFLKLASIRRMENERYETLYQRIIAHLEDNLLTTGSVLKHDGENVTADEEMSPTVERLAVYIWLTVVDQRLPAHVARVYAHELQSMTLKDLQPQIAQNLETILVEMNAHEEIQIQYSRSRYPSAQDSRSHPRRFPSKAKPSNKECILCKAAGRQHLGHTVSSCWFTSKSEKLEIAKALQVDVNTDDDDGVKDEVQIVEKVEDDIKRIQCDSSPYFYAFHKHTPCHIIVDTGATSSLVSKSFLKLAGVSYAPTSHSARTVDKSPMTIYGEVHTTVQFGDMSLPITALVVDSNLSCDFLAGVPFCRENDIQVHLKKEELTILDQRVPYGAKPSKQTHEIFKTDSFIIKSDCKKVVMPGEFIEFESDSLSGYEGEIAIEPHVDAPPNFPAPSISRVINGRIRIPNLSEDPIKLSKSQHFALIRKVTVPNSDSTSSLSLPKFQPPISQSSLQFDNTSLVSVDPDSILSQNDRDSFKEVNERYKDVFDSRLSAYNDHSGRIRAHVSIGPVLPPPRKGKLPFYNQASLQLLQEEADRLEAIGVLAKPEDVGVQVKHVSPSFLVKNPAGGHRFVTAFTELGQYTRILPTTSKSCKDVLRKLSSWKYLIKCDLKKSFYQIPVSTDSIQFLGTVTPFKGLRVYLRAAMGMPGSSECLEELICRVFGDLIESGFFIHIHDDIHVGGNSIDELLLNWTLVLQRLHDNNLKLSAPKTVICPKQMTTLGWVWNAGTLSPSAHKIAPLAACGPPQTCTRMRSFLGAFKALSQCIPKYASLVSPLEDAIKGMSGSDSIQWSDDLLTVFNKVQVALKSPYTLTIPRPSDQLVITVDASPVNNGISATLFVTRQDKRHVANFFSVKLKEHQIGWMPCEHEALGIASGVDHFSPYIRESIHKTQILTDNKACVQAYMNLQRGRFSASSRVSTFLSTISTNNVTVNHLKGINNLTSDFGSRNPQQCKDGSCQICNFANELAESVVNSVSVSDVLSGTAKMPYLNPVSWKAAQHECHILRRAFAHLTQGTRPTKKMRNVKDLKRYLQSASVDTNGLLVVRKADPFVQQRNLIIVPSRVLPGLITALHLQFTHATKAQMFKLFDRYFFGLNSESVIKNVVNACETCNALKKIPSEMFLQKSSVTAEQPGSLYSADVLRRAKQKILVIRDSYSSFTTATIIPDEGHSVLRTALLHDTSLFRLQSSVIRVDNAPGFTALRDDQQLQLQGLTLDFGRVKNTNKNAVADKAIQELEAELVRTNPSGGTISSAELGTAVRSLNQRIRNRGLSAREILLQRDQNTGEQLVFKDKTLSCQQQATRSRNHIPSARSKARGGDLVKECHFFVGDLVYIKGEGDKFHGRERYMVTEITGDNATLQKMSGTLFASRRYIVPLSRIFPISPKDRSDQPHYNWDAHSQDSSDSDEDRFSPTTTIPPETTQNQESDSDDPQPVPTTGDANVEDAAENSSSSQESVDTSSRPQRQRHRPAWYNDYDFS